MYTFDINELRDDFRFLLELCDSDVDDLVRLSSGNGMRRFLTCGHKEAAAAWE